MLVAIVKKRLGLKPDLYTLLQILSVTLLEKIELEPALSQSGYSATNNEFRNQLQLFEF